MTTSDTSGQTLTDICSALQYSIDRDGPEGVIQSTITGVRWTPAQDHPIEYLDLVSRLPDGEFRIVRVTAMDLGPHTHQYQPGTNFCHVCCFYDEALDEEGKPVNRDR